LAGGTGDERGDEGIARIFGGRDHTTVIHAVEKLAEHVHRDLPFPSGPALPRGFVGA
jgi:hypothetical protein